MKSAKRKRCPTNENQEIEPLQTAAITMPPTLPSSKFAGPSFSSNLVSAFPANYQHPALQHHHQQQRLSSLAMPPPAMPPPPPPPPPPGAPFDYMNYYQHQMYAAAAASAHHQQQQSFLQMNQYLMNNHKSATNTNADCKTGDAALSYSAEINDNTSKVSAF